MAGDRSTLPETAKPNASYKDYVLVTVMTASKKNTRMGGRYPWHPGYSVFASWHVKWPSSGLFHCPGMGPQRHANGEQTSRAVQILPALTGHFGLPEPTMGTGHTEHLMVFLLCRLVKIPLRCQSCYLWTDARFKVRKMTATTMGA